jgi:hypothetical protein
MAVPKMGYFVCCIDTEGNPFAIWEENKDAVPSEEQVEWEKKMHSEGCCCCKD